MLFVIFDNKQGVALTGCNYWPAITYCPLASYRFTLHFLFLLLWSVTDDASEQKNTGPLHYDNGWTVEYVIILSA